MIKSNLQDLQSVKKSFLTAMTKTKSWLMFEDIKDIIFDEQTKDFFNAKKEYLRNFYLKINSSEAVRNQIDDLIQENLDKETYEIVIDENGSFIIQEMGYNTKDRIVGIINLDKLDIIKLAKIVEKSMQKHLEFNSFSNNGILSAEEIPQMLEEYINLAKEYQENVVIEDEVNKEEKVDEKALTKIETNGIKGFWNKIIDKINSLLKNKKEK